MFTKNMDFYEELLKAFARIYTPDGQPLYQSGENKTIPTKDKTGSHTATPEKRKDGHSPSKNGTL